MTADPDVPFAPLALVADPPAGAGSFPAAPSAGGASAGGAVGGYRGLKLWQRSVDVAAEAHRLARAFPVGEQESIGGDLRRAAAAVAGHVAAGSLTYDRAEHLRALQVALAAVARLETVAAVAQRLGFLPAQDAVALLVGTADVTRLLRGLMRTLGPQRASASDGASVVAEGWAEGRAGAAVGGRAAEAGVGGGAGSGADGGVSDQAVDDASPAREPAVPPSIARRAGGRRRSAAAAAK